MLIDLSCSSVIFDGSMCWEVVYINYCGVLWSGEMKIK